MVDYFSRYPEVLQLTSTSWMSVISALKSVFSRHGIPEILRSDNGPQYSSAEFMSFASSYGFHHLMSSPKFPQSNGQAERAVQTIKNLLKKSRTICIHLYWVTEQLRCLGVILVQRNWTWEEGFELQSLWQTRCSYHNGFVWKPSESWTRNRNQNRKRTLIWDIVQEICQL